MKRDYTSLKQLIGVILVLLGVFFAVISFVNLPPTTGANASETSVLKDMAYSITYGIFSATSLICASILLTNKIA